MTLTTDYGTYDVHIHRSTYYKPKNLAIMLDYDEGPFATLTVNLEGAHLPADCAYVDTNNCPWAEEFIAAYKLGKYLGIHGHSGFCEYPLYRFDLDKIPKG